MSARLNSQLHPASIQAEKGPIMGRKIFVNLPVKDLNRSMTFFKKLGFSFNPQFTDETAACMVVSDDNFVMLLTEAKFKTFTPKQISDASKSTEVLVALSCESRQEAEEMVRKAVAAGGSTYAEPNDHGFMYQHGFQDPDSHIWEIFYMDPSAIPPQT
jgi:predicted lactoylglutathione lyase